MDESQQNCGRLILLPGMDGTGDLLKPLIDELARAVNCSIISLPTGEDQSYNFLTEYVRERLGGEDGFVLLAESFSGPIAYRLLQDASCKIASVIFVASFIKRPTRLINLVYRLVPAFLLNKWFLSNLAVKVLLTGFKPGDQLLSRFWDAFRKIGAGTLKSRMNAVASLPPPMQRIDRPCFYIQAIEDLIVPGHNYREFQKLFESIRLFRIKGPHLVLQARPKECADIVKRILLLSLSAT
jgi:pimeloyl-ACP methyl ester carboxylesterase